MMRDGTALWCRSLIGMRSQVQVLAGPPAIPPAHGHLGRSSTLPLPARPTGSCQPCATSSGGELRLWDNEALIGWYDLEGGVAVWSAALEATEEPLSERSRPI